MKHCGDRLLAALGLRGYIPRMVVRQASVLMRDCAGRVLDVACGKGVLLPEVVSHGNKRVFGIDIAEDQLAVAKATGMETVRGSIFEMPFARDSFDVAVCFNTLYNFDSLQDLSPVFGELARVVRPDGWIMLDLRNADNLMLNLKYRMHMAAGKHPTVAHPVAAVKDMMASHGCSCVLEKPVGSRLKGLAWGYLLVFSKRCEA